MNLSPLYKQGLPLWKRGNKGDLIAAVHAPAADKSPPTPLFQRGEGCHDSRKARLMEEYSRPATGKILERALETFRKRSE